MGDNTNHKNMPKEKRTFLDKIAKAKDEETGQEISIKEEDEVSAKDTKEKGEGEDWFSDYEGQLTVDVYQTDNELVVKSTIAGVKPEDIHVSLNNDMLTIKGERKAESEVKEEDYYCCESSYGSFSRSIAVPSNVDAKKIEASYEDGVLEVIIPKAPEVKPKKISVSAKKKEKTSK